MNFFYDFNKTAHYLIEIHLYSLTFSEEQEVAPPTEGTFKWESAIIGVLKRAPDNEISIKKLRKKVNNTTGITVNRVRAGQSGLCVLLNVYGVFCHMLCESVLSMFCQELCEYMCTVCYVCLYSIQCVLPVVRCYVNMCVQCVLHVLCVVCVQCTMCSTKCYVYLYSVQCVLPSVMYICTVYSVFCQVICISVQCAVCSAKCYVYVYSVQCVLPSVMYICSAKCCVSMYSVLCECVQCVV